MPSMFVLTNVSSPANVQVFRLVLFALFSDVKTNSSGESIAAVLTASDLIRLKRPGSTTNEPLYFKKILNACRATLLLKICSLLD